MRRSAWPLALLAALHAALLASGPACGPQAAEPTRRIDRVIDLLARIPQAECSPALSDMLRHSASIDPEDPRDRIDCIRLPAGQWIEWHGLRAGADARLAFACGVAFTRDGVPDTPVTFRVEAWPDGEDREAARVLELARWPYELATSDRGETVELPLGAEPDTWNVRIEVTDDGAGATWPGIFAPRLLSQGRVPRPEDDLLPLRVLDTDLMDDLGRAEVLQENADSPVARALLDAGDAEFDGRRMCLRAAAPSRVRFTVTPPADSRLRFGLGMDKSEGWECGGDGMVFAVEVDGTRLFERVVIASELPADRSWRDGEVDLSPYAGRQVAIDLVTEPIGDAAFDIGGWVSPTIAHAQPLPRLREGEAPTVIVLLADTLRADRFGAGAPGSRTPRLDREAARGLRFPRARSVTSWTWPTIGSLFTGLYPGEHGVDTDSGFYLVAGQDTLAERFQRRGYTTGAFVANPLIGGSCGFDQGFEAFVPLPYARARTLNDRVLDWFDATEGLARLVYVHYFDTHQPYLPPPEFAPDIETHPTDLELAAEIAEARKRVKLDQDLVARWMGRQELRYDAEVRYLDTAIGELLDALEQRGALDDALIVFASDHGEEFYEHGLTGHGWQLYDETVRVPLFIAGRGPSALPPGDCDRPVEIRAVLPTLVDLLGLDRAGRERLGPSLLDDVPPGPVFGQTGLGVEHGILGVTPKQFVVNDGHKLILTPVTGRLELYDLAADPGETKDRSKDKRLQERMAGLEADLAAWLARTTPSAPAARVELDADAQIELQQLGYVGR